MSLMDFVTGPASLSIHDPVSLLGARFLGRGKQQKKIDTPRRITFYREYIMYNITKIQNQILKVFNINALVI
jgi:hypothetical protein